MDKENKYLVTLLANNSDEAYLTAVLENTEGGRILSSIIQNSNVSSDINVADIKWFLSKIQKCDIDDLPDLTKFLETNVLVVPAKGRPTDLDIIMRLDL